VENKIVYIGFLGVLQCYLNVEKEVAISRYCETNDMSIEEFSDNGYEVRVIEFDDEFGAYDLWEI
jgi:ATP-dependent RNA circularization protein (DNA/RNA ligase family)